MLVHWLAVADGKEPRRSANAGGRGRWRLREWRSMPAVAPSPRGSDERGREGGGPCSTGKTTKTIVYSVSVKLKYASHLFLLPTPGRAARASLLL